ncbi:MAG: branched-chain amino acid aminotransferase [Bdellovibrionaceae bacterium]|nr:branched-chain amino acid aminotransferase [Bdellovibrionales bacterium]MCB9085027.1 branched-chain amino acid aminotransferase [Pseudobdellovibrionaceae bacterium]
MKIEILGQCKSLIEQTSLPQDLGFGRFFSPVMIECHFRQGEWQMPRLKPYAPLQLDPATMVFHYGQSIFEGLKAYRSGSNLHLFRPWDHARRFIKSGQRLAMPALPEDMFMEALVEFCRMSAPLVPEDDQSTLYLRPFMFADQVGLGVRPADSYVFMIIGSPSGRYFADQSVRVMIERKLSRAASTGGTGAVKTAGNYASSLLSDRTAKQAGFHQTLWLDSAQTKYVEELTGMNIFFVKRGKLVTPKLNNSILAGITRDTLKVLAEDLGVSFSEEPVAIDEILSDIKSGTCEECFVCGTAAGITPVAMLGDLNGESFTFDHANGPTTQKMAKALFAAQRNQRPTPEGWIISI